MDDRYFQKAGAILFFSEGEYSDYSVSSHVRFLVDCDLEKALSDWLRSIYHEQKDPLWCDVSKWAFVAWLVSRGFCEYQDVDELHLGGYGRIEVGGVCACHDRDAWKMLQEDPKRENGIIRPEYRDPDSADPYRGQAEA